MKSKGTWKTLGLALAVIGVWGWIGLQVRQALTSDGSELFIPATIAKNSSDSSGIRTDTLFLNYPDPFFEKSPRRSEVNRNRGTISQPMIQQPTIDISKFAYNGSYYNKRVNTLLAVIVSSGQEHIVKVGDSVDGLRLDRILPDSVCLYYYNRPYWIKKHSQ